MKRTQRTFRAVNAGWGALVGIFAGLVLFLVGYGHSDDRAPIAFDRATVVGLAEFISWPWFIGIVLLCSLWGFLFNNWIGDLLSDIYHYLR